MNTPPQLSTPLTSREQENYDKPIHFRRVFVSVAILFFDCSRLLFLLALLAAQVKPAEMFRIGGFPYIMCAAPNALFPLISFFLFIYPQMSKPYIPLYITGKCLALLCMVLWFMDRLVISGADSIMWVFFLGIADIGTIMGMAVLGTISSEEKIVKGGE
jgi:hypothetical protein